jgi:hypothetical protein
MFLLLLNLKDRLDGSDETNKNDSFVEITLPAILL